MRGGKENLLCESLEHRKYITVLGVKIIAIVWFWCVYRLLYGTIG